MIRKRRGNQLVEQESATVPAKAAYGQTVSLHGFDGVALATSAALTSLGYSGEHFDAKAQQQYLRARFYNPANGRFNRLDPFAGNMQDPQSLHKYAYVHGDPIQGIDPSGLMSLAGKLAVASISSGLVSIVGNGLSNVANRRDFFQGASHAYVFGAIAGPGAFLFPVVGIILGSAFFVHAATTNIQVFGDDRSTRGQQAAALGLLLLSVVGGGFAARNVRSNGFWFNKNVFGVSGRIADSQAIESLNNRSTSQPQPQVREIARVTQDEAVNPNPPPALDPVGRTVGGSRSQNAAVGRYVDALIRLGAEDIRVNQQQVNANGQRVGINRPDLQFTWRGLRYYIEWDRLTSDRGVPHAERALANDPQGMTLTFELGN